MKRYCALCLYNESCDTDDYDLLQEENVPYTVWIKNPKAGQPLVGKDGKPFYKTKNIKDEKGKVVGKETVKDENGQPIQKLGSPKIRDYRAEEELIDSGKLDDVLDLKKHLIITAGADKLQGINSINVDPRMVKSCNTFHKNPKMICSKCYSYGSIEGLKPNLGTSFRVNHRLLTKEVYPIGSFPSDKKRITKKFRINSHGDIDGEIHMMNCLHFIKQNVDAGNIEFCCWWTKEHQYFAKIKAYAEHIKLDPDKLGLIFSTYLLDDPEPKPMGGADRFFSVYSYDYLKANNIDPAHFINCGGEECDSCSGAVCYHKNGHKNIKELLKQDKKRWESDVKKGVWK